METPGNDEPVALYHARQLASPRPAKTLPFMFPQMTTMLSPGSRNPMRQTRRTARLVCSPSPSASAAWAWQRLQTGDSCSERHREVQDGLSLPSSLREVVALPPPHAKPHFHSHPAGC